MSGNESRAQPLPAARVVAASELEASDDLMLRILSHLTVPERLGLAAVSKRWCFLVNSFSELRFSAGQEPHVIRACVRARAMLTRLDLTGLGADVDFVEALHDAFRQGDLGRHLRQLVVWDDATTETAVGEKAVGLTFRLQVVRDICKASPLLDEGTRLRVSRACSDTRDGDPSPILLRCCSETRGTLNPPAGGVQIVA